MLRSIVAAILVLLAHPVLAHDREELDGQAILALAREAHGGESWANARTLTLQGRAVFYGADGPDPRSRADDYRMWRVFNQDRDSAHGAQGKVRVTAKSGSRVLFEIGYDGETTWNERGIVPQAEADAFWATNFGFGIIRHAAKRGFSATRLPDDFKGGHAVFMVELTDASGGKTLFGIDMDSHAVRYLGFDTERGWHERTYDDFVRLPHPDWLQARRVTLYYDGRKSNEVFWDTARVNTDIDPRLFSPPSR